MTVTDVELLKRRLSLDEVVALAALFAVPAVEFLLPPDGTQVALREDRVVPADRRPRTTARPCGTTR